MTTRGIPSEAMGLARGAKSTTARQLNEYLSRFGYLRLPGQQPVVAQHTSLPEAQDPEVFDEATEEALQEFQTSYSLAPSGTVDADTLGLLQTPRCGVPDGQPVGPGAPEDFVVSGRRWTKSQLGFRLTRGTPDLSDAQVNNALAGAYRKWCLVAPLVVHLVTHHQDIDVRFEVGDHGDGSPFDGAGGATNILAHAFPPPDPAAPVAIDGDLHFDDFETWTRSVPTAGRDLDTTALHEAGHTLGLNHSLDAAAVMYAFDNGIQKKLHPDDIAGIRKIYGTRDRNEFTNFDAAVTGAPGPAYDKAYFFYGFRYLRYDWLDDLPDAGYPQHITPSWRGIPETFSFPSGIDTALNGQGDSRGKLYMFKGDRYLRYDWIRDRMDAGYPAQIVANWHGLPPSFTHDLDAAVDGRGPATGKAYFFKGGEYVRYDFARDAVDPGYPHQISGDWRGLPDGFTSDIDAVMNGGPGYEDKLYFFKGADYVRYDWKKDRADPNYPQPILFNWF